MKAERRVVVARRIRPRRPVAPGRARFDPGRRPADVPAIVGRQLRQALLTVGAVIGLLVGIPVVAVWVPGPWAWVALSVAVQGAWVGLSVLHLRRAERLER